jgi:hypothetical protein
MYEGYTAYIYIRSSLIKYVNVLNKRAAHVYSIQLAQKEGRIALVIQAFKQGHILSLRTTTKVYDIPKTILRDRVKGILVRRDTVPINRKLTTIKESTLIKSILSID